MQCGLTPRSRGDPTRRATLGPRRAVAGSIVLRGPRAPRLAGRLSANVRQTAECGQWPAASSGSFMPRWPATRPLRFLRRVALPPFHHTDPSRQTKLPPPLLCRAPPPALQEPASVRHHDCHRFYVERRRRGLRPAVQSPKSLPGSSPRSSRPGSPVGCHGQQPPNRDAQADPQRRAGLPARTPGLSSSSRASRHAAAGCLAPTLGKQPNAGRGLLWYWLRCASVAHNQAAELLALRHPGAVSPHSFEVPNEAPAAAALSGTAACFLRTDFCSAIRLPRPRRRTATSWAATSRPKSLPGSSPRSSRPSSSVRRHGQQPPNRDAQAGTPLRAA